MATVIKHAGPKRRRWTRKEFYKLLDLGFFRRERLELIEGEIVVMPAQKNLHLLSIKLTEDALNAVFGTGYWVRVQGSLDLTPYSVVDPDLAVVQGNPRDFSTESNPTTALLIVEVSQTTLRFDRGRKASLYARAGIADYWVINLADRCLEIRRNPVPDNSQHYGYGYASLTTLAATDYATPLAAPQARILV